MDTVISNRTRCRNCTAKQFTPAGPSLRLSTVAVAVHPLERHTTPVQALDVASAAQQRGRGVHARWPQRPTPPPAA